MLLRPSTRWMLLAVLTAFVVFVPSSFAAPAPMPLGPTPALFSHPMPISQMTLREKERFQLSALRHYRSVVHAFLEWRKANVLSPLAAWAGARVPATFDPVPMSMCKALGIVTSPNVCWYASAARWTMRELATTQARIKALSAWPAHHLLWLCIHGTPSLGTEVGHEASSWSNADTGGNGHYGGLQMHKGWGYGTSYYASDDSQLVQERAAENAYRASGYSPSFLTQQWGETIGPCWQYAAH